MNYRGTEYQKERCKRWRLDHPEQRGDIKERRKRNLAAVKRYQAAHPEQVREADKYRTRAYYVAHREEKQVYHRRWRKANPEKFAAQCARHRALKLKTSIGIVDYMAIKVRDKMICGICHKRVAKKDLSFDHIVPLAEGGSHTEDNLQVAHRKCNSRKGIGRLPSQTRLVI